ncbi:hypothetical protein TorRG33x02_182740 [Trema orientale]|uniref:Uncharacterized protein n=1 Tax=Trema orientale TaxID=63057 RepID=A0A2P5EK61_TREOI|nr:hypothetical protein TorRG33x02_182740 [Trema orientale]
MPNEFVILLDRAKQTSLDKIHINKRKHCSKKGTFHGLSKIKLHPLMSQWDV